MNKKDLQAPNLAGSFLLYQGSGPQSCSQGSVPHSCTTPQQPTICDGYYKVMRKTVIVS